MMLRPTSDYYSLQCIKPENREEKIQLGQTVYWDTPKLSYPKSGLERAGPTGWHLEASLQDR